MRCLSFLFIGSLIASCDGELPLRFLNPPSRVKVYLGDAATDTDCESLITRLFKKERVGELVSNTLLDFEAEGFGNIHIPHLPALKKMFVILVVSDPSSEKVLYYGCAENVEVSPNASHELPIVLVQSQREFNDGDQ